MAKSDMVEKRKLLVDNEEIKGLIECPEYEIAEGVVEVPGQSKTVPVKNGVRVIPQIPMTFKITRGSTTYNFFKDWRNKNEVKNCVMIRTDGRGKEIARELWPNVECSKLNGGPYDASAPATSIANVVLLPEDIVDIDAES